MTKQTTKQKGFPTAASNGVYKFNQYQAIQYDAGKNRPLYFIIDAMKEQMTKENSIWRYSYILEADNISCKKYSAKKEGNDR